MGLGDLGSVCDRPGRKCGCRCGGEVRGFLQPRLLLLLAENASHGYELLEALRSTPGAETPSDPGMLYRTLRQLEECGAVCSVWDTKGHGPARRVYKLTAIGREHLECWAADIRKTRLQLDQFLAEYESITEYSSPSRQQERG
jgi:poly-beta-hydroxybutyrate-responsive repressor